MGMQADLDSRLRGNDVPTYEALMSSGFHVPTTIPAGTTTGLLRRP